jgi:hypothetical protein
MKLRNKILLIGFGSAFVLLIGLFLALFRFGLLEYLVNRKLQNIIGVNLPLKVQIGQIGGDYYSQLVLSDVMIIYSDSLYKYTMAEIPMLTAEYSLSDIWQGNLKFSKIAVDHAKISLRKSREKNWLFPKPQKATEQKAPVLNFEVNNIILNNFDINLFDGADSLLFKNIYLKGKVEGREKTYTADIDNLSYRSSDSRFNLNSASGKITLTGNNLMFQDFIIKTDSSDLGISGLAVLEKDLFWKSIMKARRINFQEFSSFLGTQLKGNISADGTIEYKDQTYSGTLSISGIFMDRQFDSLWAIFQFFDNRLKFDSLDGTILNGCRLIGHGDINLGRYPEEYRLTGRINNFNLKELVFDTYKSDLSGKINVSGHGLEGNNLTLDVTADLDESWFDTYHAYKSGGMMTITSDSIILHDEFEIEYQDNIFSFKGKLAYSGGIELDGATQFDDLSAFNGQTFIDRMGGRADLAFKVTGELENPDITGQLVSDSLWLYDLFSQKAAIDFRLNHFLYNRKGEVRLDLRSGMAYDFPYDSIIMGMTVDSFNVFIDSARINNNNVNVVGRGLLNYASYPQRLLIDTISMTTLGLSLTNDGLIDIGIDSLGYNFLNCRLLRPTGFIESKGRVNYDESMALNVAMGNIDIAPFVRLIIDTMNVGGVFSGESQIAGNFLSPRIKYLGRIDSLSYGSLVLGDLYADVNYNNKEIKIDSITLDSHTGYYIARGTFPIDLSFQKINGRFTDQEQNIAITAYDNRMDGVSLMLDAVENLTGDFRADFNLTGKALKPKINGNITLHNGHLKLYDLVQPLDSLNIDMKMVDKTVSIDSISAVCISPKSGVGTVSGSGQIVINSIDSFDYNIKLKLKDFYASYELGDASGLVDADLNVFGETPPTVSGDVTLKSALYREEFSKESDGWVILTSLEGDKTWDLNLNIIAVSNLWIKNSEIDAELSGQLNYIREKGKENYFGSMEILRGKSYLAGRTFRIEPAGTINYEDIEYPNPRLDIYATTKIRGSSPTQSGASQSTSYELRVHITGTLDEPIINAAEGSSGSPQFTTEEIVPLIFTDYYSQGNSSVLGSGGQVGERITSGISGYLSSQFTQIGSRSLGVETFEIDPVYGNKFDPLGTRLTVGFYTHPNLYIYGRSAISSVSGSEVGFEYRLKRFLLIEGSRDEQELYHLLLNFYWDY